MGFLDSVAMNQTFAVEMDTVQNMELRDIDNNHVGIHNGSMFSTSPWILIPLASTEMRTVRSTT